MDKNYSLGNIRTLLIEGFADEELRAFCFDAPDFKPVYHQLARSTGKTEIVSHLLEYAEQKSIIEPLLDWAKERNPVRYKQHQPYHDAPLIPNSRKDFEPETILIPAGSFLMGDPEAVGEWQQHPFTLPTYGISKYPVTNEQYAQFVAQNSDRRPQKAGWRFTIPPQDKLDAPVVGVSWYDGLTYCEWLSRQTHLYYRLPTEAEWEKAAKNAQDFVVIDNIREWTSTLWGEDWHKAKFRYPYRNDERENLIADSTFLRIYRGRACGNKSQQHHNIRGYYAPQARDKGLGFRVVLEVKNRSGG